MAHDALCAHGTRVHRNFVVATGPATDLEKHCSRGRSSCVGIERERRRAIARTVDIHQHLTGVIDDIDEVPPTIIDSTDQIYCRYVATLVCDQNAVLAVGIERGAESAVADEARLVARAHAVEPEFHRPRQ